MASETITVEHALALLAADRTATDAAARAYRIEHRWRADDEYRRLEATVEAVDDAASILQELGDPKRTITLDANGDRAEQILGLPELHAHAERRRLAKVIYGELQRSEDAAERLDLPTCTRLADELWRSGLRRMGDRGPTNDGLIELSNTFYAAFQRAKLDFDSTDVLNAVFQAGFNGITPDIITPHRFLILDEPTTYAVNHAMRQTGPDGVVALTPVLIDDWLIFARDRDGKPFYIITELWEEWCDLPAGADQEPDAIKRYMLPAAWYRGYFHHPEFWEPVEDQFAAGIPTATLGGAAPWWDETPTLPAPASRIEEVVTIEPRVDPSAIDEETGISAEERLLRAIFGEPTPPKPRPQGLGGL